MPQIHLRAERGDYAPLVLMPGDPGRATMMAALLDGGMDKARRVNQHRSLLGYTGTYKGKPVSIQTSGIGTPSFSIVMEELLMLGATRFIRTGTCGGIGHGLRTGDVVVATASVPMDGSTRTYLHGDPFAPAADFELTRALIDAARAMGIEPNPGLIQSVDVFYNPDSDYAAKMRSRGVIAVEMEASALFYLASREQGLGHDVRGACILTVSDTLIKDDEAVGADYMALEDLEKATMKMIEIALEAGTSLP
ncbi:MAG: purine-nucleoside phosphorylase [Chloroflexota bacterium]|jgi:DeoD family purine-nucleoside phosphorylase|nr:purine-nucleoside phosphorylase [Chloroflexota bacterium]